MGVQTLMKTGSGRFWPKRSISPKSLRGKTYIPCGSGGLEGICTFSIGPYRKIYVLIPCNYFHLEREYRNLPESPLIPRIAERSRFSGLMVRKVALCG